MMRKLLFLSFSFLLFTTAVAQEVFLKGGVVTLNNDTIPGEILIIKSTGYLMKIAYRDTTLGIKKKYRADKIKGFSSGGRWFESMTWKDTHYFFERLVSGNVSLYCSIYISPAYVFLQPSGQLVGGPSSAASEYFLVRGTAKTLLNVFDFKKFMSAYVKDCPALSLKIENKELGYNEIVKIVEEYNSCNTAR